MKPQEGIREKSVVSFLLPNGKWKMIAAEE
jgi:hypothetical protein